MPWVWWRRLLAREWHVPPWVVDEAPWDEVELALSLMDIEAEGAANRQRVAQQLEAQRRG